MTRALRALPDVPQNFNHTHIATWLAALKQEQPSSFFESIQPIPAGHYLRITPGGLECRQYWHPSDAKPIRYRKDDEYAEALVEILDTAVEARLRTAHPVGSFL